MLRYLLAVLYLACFALAGSSNCPNYNSNSWISLEAIDCYAAYDDNKNLTNNDYCWSSIDFSLQTHVNLENTWAKKKSGKVGDDFSSEKECGQNETEITHCTSHCMDKNLENALVQAAMNPYPTTRNSFNTARTAMAAQGKGDWPLLFVEPFVSNSKINFQYYDDMNFCVVDLLFMNPRDKFADPVRSFFFTHKTVPLN